MYIKAQSCKHHHI